jgi:hypothetical protein
MASSEFIADYVLNQFGVWQGVNITIMLGGLIQKPINIRPFRGFYVQMFTQTGQAPKLDFLQDTVRHRGQIILHIEGWQTDLFEPLEYRLAPGTGRLVTAGDFGAATPDDLFALTADVLLGYQRATE